VFRIYDTRAGRVEEVGSEPGGLLRLYIPGPSPNRPAQFGELRSLLVADLIRRNAEHRHGLTVVASLLVPGTGNDGGAAAPGAEAMGLNIRPAEQTTPAAAREADLAAPAPGQADPTAAPGPADPTAPAHAEPGEIIVEAQPGLAAGGSVRHAVRVGPVTFDDRDAGAQVPLSALAENGLDPLAARLALMSFRHAEQAALTWDTLAEADRDLRRWRRLVAEWAEWPSRPMCAEVTANVAAAFDTDLDTPAALRALRGLEDDPQIPPGSKFESFLHADQLLALDLPREIGRAQ
jgi:hypothetical protein